MGLGVLDHVGVKGRKEKLLRGNEARDEAHHLDLELKRIIRLAQSVEHLLCVP